MRTGLSPLAWGTHWQYHQEGRQRRFIPAGAGNTNHETTDTVTYPVYPRWRGEHRLKQISFWYGDGLSPLARGTLYQCYSVQRQGRFIPAGAGNTFGSSPSRPVFSVYPRWRGEHRAATLVARIICGLSPLARGTQIVLVHFLQRLRFIPAGAGNTSETPVMRRLITVYPRWRGEHASRRVAR